MKKYNFQSFENDANHVRLYTLKNGLQVYLAQNFDSPRIQTFIPVKTGSNNDPSDNTGLAHYLEHMMFKGTSKIGTLNWEKESVLLQKISDLYEKHKASSSIEEKKEIYHQIDQLSQEASQYALANEYDKLLSTIGASGTNAHTWLDETVYKNNIPSNEIKNWLKIESERFSELVLRLFHTELETVYEEFNRAQDNDSRLVHYAMLKALFPNHPNGQQTTLGSAEHLRNPSMEAIHKYFSTYYVPNNMAIVMVGDLDFEKTIALVDQYFGNLQYKELPKKTEIEEAPLKSKTTLEVFSPSSPRLHIAWRTDSYGTKASWLAEISFQILSNNGEVGLLDININQSQKALRAMAYHSPFKKYGYLSMAIIPKEDQSLEEAEALLLEEIEKLKRGDFPDWLISAVIKNFEIARTKSWETSEGLAFSIYETFIKERSWQQELEELSILEQITKEEVVAFAKEFFADNYVAIYKRQGENQNLIRVENPGITPVKLNKSDVSDFFKETSHNPVTPIQPVFVDYQAEVKEQYLSGKKLSFVQNKINNLAQLSFIFNLGTDHNKEIPLALNYLEYLGTDQYSAEDLRAQFYQLGVEYVSNINHERLMIQLSGLEENMPKALSILQHWFSNAIAEEDLYQETVNTILQTRSYAKNDKSRIALALNTYAKLEAESRFRDVLSKEHLLGLKGKDVIKIINTLFQYPYQIYFYGQHLDKFTPTLEQFITPESFPIPEPKKYIIPQTTGKIYFVHYDMVQAEIFNISKVSNVDLSLLGTANVFNEYFGSGLSSIVFQEIRESRSLAYSAYANYTYANELNKANYFSNYIGTQADKLTQAVEAMKQLMTKLPKEEGQFANAKENVLKQMATNRIPRRKLFTQYLAIQRYGIAHDLRKDIYHEVENLTWEDLEKFFNQEVIPAQFNTAILGNRNLLKDFPNAEELSLEEIFGY